MAGDAQTVSVRVRLSIALPAGPGTSYLPARDLTQRSREMQDSMPTGMMVVADCTGSGRVDASFTRMRHSRIGRHQP